MYGGNDTGSRTFDDLSPGCLFEELALRYDCLFTRSSQDRYLRHFERGTLYDSPCQVFNILTRHGIQGLSRIVTMTTRIK